MKIIRGLIIAVLFFYGIAPSYALYPPETDATDAGLAWEDGIEPGEPDECEAVGGNCYWVDCDAVADGAGSYASPYWGFETVGGYWDSGTQDAGSFVQGSAQEGDVIYVKGTCSFTDSVESADGPKKTAQFNRLDQFAGLSADKPLTIKSYRGTARAVFDGESSNSNSTLIGFDDQTDTGGSWVKVQNIKLINSQCHGINQWGVERGEVYSVECADFEANGTTGTCGCSSQYAQSAAHAWEYVVNKSYAHGFTEDFSGHPDNVGFFSLISGNDENTGTWTVKNSKGHDGYVGVRTKQKNALTTYAYNNLFYEIQQGVFVRGKTTNIHHNIFKDITGNGAVFLTGGNGTALLTANVYNNSVYGFDLYFVGVGEQESDEQFALNIYNNAVYDTINTNKWIAFGLYGTYSSDITQITHDHNVYYPSAPSLSLFAEADNVEYSYTAFLAALTPADTSTKNVDPGFTNVSTLDFSISPSSQAATAGRDGAYVGAIEPNVPFARMFNSRIVDRYRRRK